jgi:predicted enzyme related to lactoylglutathione lyase
MARICYVELPITDIGSGKSFYETAFGWSLTDFGPSYASTMNRDVDLGLQADTSEATAEPLVVIEVENLETALASIESAGGSITRPIFAFPGGRRFHFRDPAGNELAAMKPD